MNKDIAYYIDDEEKKAKKMARRLSEINGLDVRHLLPTPDLSVKEIDGETALFFVDYELDKVNPSAPTTVPVTYKGGAFAQQLRDKFPDHPIVLVTKESIFDVEAGERYVQSQSIFDTFISKSEMSGSPELVVEKALILIEGFSCLRHAAKTWDSFLDALQADSEEGIAIGEAAAPIEKSKNNWTWNVLYTAKWVSNILLEYPGILLDSLHAATFLGISQESFLENTSLQSLIEKARYQGVFAPKEGRWWKSRLREIAYDVRDETQIRGDINSCFAPAFFQKTGEQLSPSVCVFSGESPADWVCYVLKEPVKISYSLLYYPDSRPAIMDDARVSFRAIRNNNDVFENFFPPSNKELIEQIRSNIDD